MFWTRLGSSVVLVVLALIFLISGGPVLGAVCLLDVYKRQGRLFESDDARMDFGLLLGAVFVVFLAMNLFGSLYRNMMLRGPLHECMCVIRNNAISFAGAAVVLYFMGLLDAYSRLVFFYFLLIDCIPVSYTHLDVYKRQIRY